jgi:hypothetical protein
LPLDKIVSQTAPSTNGESRSNDLVGQVANEVIERLRQEQIRARRTETR